MASDKKEGGMKLGIVIPWGRDHDYAAHEKRVAEANAIIDERGISCSHFSTVAEITRLADEILAHPEYSGVVRRAGIDGDFSEVEEKAIDAFIDGLWREKDTETPYYAYASLPVAPALARRVAAGVFADVNSAEARDFVYHNIAHPNIIEQSGGRKGFKSPNRPLAHVREVICVAEAIHANPRMWELMNIITNRELDRSEEEGEVLDFMDKIAKKYGMLWRKFGFAASKALNVEMVRGNISSFYDDRAIKSLKKKSKYFLPVLTFEGPSSVE